MLTRGGSGSKTRFKDSSSDSDHETKKQKLCDETDKICMLLEDLSMGGAPKHVRLLLENFENRKLLQSELLFLLIYVVALECGYVERSVYDNHYGDIEPVSPANSFHMKNVRELARHAPNYTHDGDNAILRLTLCSAFAPTTPYTASRQTAGKIPLLSSTLTGIATGDLFVVALSPEPAGNERGYSQCLSINRFVLGPQSKSRPLYQRFQKMDELSLLLRQHLFNPMRIQQAEQLVPQLCPTLIGLPTELYDAIFKYLNTNQLNVLANVNHHLNAMVNFSKYRPKKRP